MIIENTVQIVQCHRCMYVSFHCIYHPSVEKFRVVFHPSGQKNPTGRNPWDSGLDFEFRLQRNQSRKATMEIHRLFLIMEPQNHSSLRPPKMCSSRTVTAFFRYLRPQRLTSCLRFSGTDGRQHGWLPALCRRQSYRQCCRSPERRYSAGPPRRGNRRVCRP